jgi:hypothetical protein
LRPFPGKTNFRRSRRPNGGRTWAHVNFRRSLSPPSLCLSFIFILGCMHSTQYTSMIYPHIGPRVHHTLHYKPRCNAAQRASLACCFNLFASVFGRGEATAKRFSFFVFRLFIYFYFPSPRGLGLQFAGPSFPDGSWIIAILIIALTLWNVIVPKGMAGPAPLQ